jgi:glucokinase
LIDRINRKGLLDSFLWKESRFNKMLRNFPLYAVINDGLGLLGAREYATRLLLAPELCKSL